MTIPSERYRALVAGKQLLLDLCNSKSTENVPSNIRQRARDVLRHYPFDIDIEIIAEKIPQLYKKET
jgi:hypothetical protein